MGQKSVLGKGLASLLPAAGMNVAPAVGAVAAAEPTTVQQQEFGNRDRHPGIGFIAVDEIVTNPFQPRQEFDSGTLNELVQSIRTNGIIQPLIVRKNPHGGYQLIAGERRFRAAKEAGLKQVPVVIRKTTDREALELALIENIQREDLNCIDEALAYLQLVQDFSLTQEEVAERVGKDRVSVANHLRLLRLPEVIIEDLRRRVLSFGHGKALLSIEDNEAKVKIRNQILENKLSVRAVEALVEELYLNKLDAAQEANKKSAETGVGDPLSTPLRVRMSTLAQDLTKQWSTRVEFRGNEKRGKILIHYATREELDRILVAMQNKDLWVSQQT